MNSLRDQLLDVCPDLERDDTNLAKWLDRGFWCLLACAIAGVYGHIIFYLVNRIGG